MIRQGLGCMKVFSLRTMAAGPGLEPEYRAPKARVLPLDDPAAPLSFYEASSVRSSDGFSLCASFRASSLSFFRDYFAPARHNMNNLGHTFV